MAGSRRALIVVVVLIGIALGIPWSDAVPEASAQSISVTAADSPAGEQGSLNLNVITKGKGFKNGAKAGGGCGSAANCQLSAASLTGYSWSGRAG